MFYLLYHTSLVDVLEDMGSYPEALAFIGGAQIA
jgi:hypothetical protein